jgi:MFS transporter, SP family, sugar:H+ symporter
MVSETKGLSLEEVDELYERVGSAWRSDGFVPVTKFRDLVGDDTNTEKVKPEDHSSDHIEVNGATTESSE